MTGDEATIEQFERLRCLYRNAAARSEVWHARDVTGREVALKLVAREPDPEEQAYRQERLQAEVEAGGLLHEHVRALLTYGADPTPTAEYPSGVDWLAFEWIEGPTLRELLASKSLGAGAIGARDLRDLARAVANGLAAMHAASPPWIHRDVKPANILLPRGDCRRALLADLGIAWRSGSPRLSRLAGIGDSGTPLYMAPEQFAMSDDIGPASDQYALALVLWECATGQVPYATSPAWSDVARARASGGALPALAVAGLAAPALGEVLQRALAPRAGERWPDLAALWQAFHEAGVRDRLWDPDISVTPARSCTRAAPETGRPPAKRSPFEVASVWVEQDAHLAGFVGRVDVLERCRVWLREGAGAYLLLSGPPGQGKSALMSRLAALEGASRDARLAASGEGACLLHMVKSHREPRRILQSLVAQAERLLGLKSDDTAFQVDVEDLRDLLVQRLEQLAAMAGRVVVVIDALDELPPDNRRADFLPPRLPARVRYVLSARPDIELLAALEAHLGGVEQISVEPLGPEEARELVSAALAEPGDAVERVLDVDTLLDRTGRTPLVLRHEIARLRPAVHRAMAQGSSERISLVGVAQSTEAVFREAYASISGQRTSWADAADGRVRASIAHILACAQEPLDVGQLRSVLRTAGHHVVRGDLQRHLDAVSQYLRPLDGKLALFHQGLVDHVRRIVLGDEDAAEVHGWFVMWLDGGVGDRTYYRNHVASHLRERWVGSGGDFGSPAMMDLFSEVTSLRYARARVAAGEVFELRRELTLLPNGGPEAEAQQRIVRTSHTSHTESQQRSAATELEESGLGRQLIRAMEWKAFLDANAHILVARPDLLLQQLRNHPNTALLARDAAAIAPDRPMLLVEEQKAEDHHQTRLRRQTITCSPVEEIAIPPGLDHFISRHENGGLGIWSLASAQGQILRAPAGSRMGLVENATGIPIRTVETDGVGAFLVMNEPSSSKTYAFPVGASQLECAAAADGRLYAAFAVGGSEQHDVYTLDLSTGEYTLLGSTPHRVRAIVAPPKAGWVAIAQQEKRPGPHGYDEDGGSEIIVFDATDGTVRGRAAMEEPTFWLGYSRPVSQLISSHADELRFWSTPNLRVLWSHSRDRMPSWMMVLHPKIPRALQFGEYWVRVLDLETRCVIRQERWHEMPSSRTALSSDGRWLVGDLGNPEDRYWREDASLGVWELSGDFWQASTEDHDAEQRQHDVVGNFADLGRTLALGAYGVLLEFSGGAPTPTRAFVGGPLDLGAQFVRTGDRELVIARDTAVHVLDVISGTVTRRFKTTGDKVHSIEQGARGLRLYWRPALADVGSDFWKERADALVAELLSQGVPIISLDDADAQWLEIAPLPWDFERDGDRLFGTSLFNLTTGTWSEFVQLPGCDYGPEYYDAMPGEEYLIYMRQPEELLVVHLASGEVVHDGSYERPLAALDTHRLLCCDDHGCTWIMDVRNGARVSCGLDVGRHAAVRLDLAFTLSPDQRLAVWNDPEAIIVSEVLSGREVARLPIHRFSGHVTFTNDRTISVWESRGRRLTLRLEGPLEDLA